MNRWLAVVGGVSMNLALGSLYAWSVFVAPLEAEFGWNRTETSWVFHDCDHHVRGLVRRGRSYPGHSRTENLRRHRRDARRSGLHPRQLHQLALLSVCRLRFRRRSRQRLWLCHAHSRRLEVVSRQAGTRRRFDGRRIRRWIRDRDPGGRTHSSRASAGE